MASTGGKEERKALPGDWEKLIKNIGMHVYKTTSRSTSARKYKLIN